MLKQIYDITIPITTKTIVWPGDPVVAIRQIAAISKGAESNLSQIRMSVHTGTHIDAPAHFIAGGKTIGDISLGKLTGQVLVVEMGQDVEVITDQCLLNHPQLEAIRKARKVLFKTRNSQLWREDSAKFTEDYVGADSSAAAFLADLDLDLIGIDYLSISPFNDLDEPHRILLAKNIILLEGTDMSRVPAGHYQLYCLPMKLESCEGAPVRAILREI
ncbi:MAG: cyclase family protein [Chloroflexota bacterium]|nr:cyclase family protein [Chloroflexota bacterium]